MKENLVTISNINVKPSAYKEEKGVIKEILEKGTKGRVDFRTGKQTTDTGKKTKEGYPIKQEKQVMKTRRKTVNNPKGRLKHSSPYGKAVGALTKHQMKQYDSESKAKKAAKAGDMKAAAKHREDANRSYQRRRSQGSKLFARTGSFHDRADND